MIYVSDFITGYIECALWADCMPSEAELAEDEGAEHGGKVHLVVPADVREAMGADCVTFIILHGADLEEYVRRVGDGYGGDGMGGERAYSAAELAGHDFWLTRNGHGAGFRDRELGELGDRLTKAAQAFGSADDHTPYDRGDGTVGI